MAPHQQPEAQGGLHASGVIGIAGVARLDAQRLEAGPLEHQQQLVAEVHPQRQAVLLRGDDLAADPLLGAEDKLRRLVEEAKLQVGVIHGYKDQLPTEQQQRFEDDTIAVEGLLNEISSEL